MTPADLIDIVLARPGVGVAVAPLDVCFGKYSLPLDGLGVGVAPLIENPVEGGPSRTAEAFRMLSSELGARPALGVDGGPIDGVEGAEPGPPDMRERRDAFGSAEPGRLILGFLVSRGALTSCEELIRLDSVGRGESTGFDTVGSASLRRLPLPDELSPMRSASDRGVIGARRSIRARTGAGSTTSVFVGAETDALSEAEMLGGADDSSSFPLDESGRAVPAILMWRLVGVGEERLPP